MLRTASWNSRGLFGSVTALQWKVAGKYQRVAGLSLKSDVLCVQETHGCAEDVEAMSRQLNQFLWFSTFCSHTYGGGCMIGIRKSIAEKFHTIRHTEVCEGRIHCIDCIGEAGSLQVVNVHLVPGLARGEWREWVGRLQSCLLLDERSVSIVIGDFNFYPAEEGRFDITSGTVIEGDGWHEEAFHDICSGLVEIEQLDPTRRQVTAEGKVTSLSRLDRAFVRGHAVDVMDMRPRAVVVGCPTKADPTSDHLPLVITLHAPRSKPVRSDAIPKWLVKHPKFDDHLAQCLDRGPADPNLRLRLFKDAVSAAAELTRKEIARGSAVSVHEKLYWSTLLFRASRSGDVRRARKATAAWPDLLRWCGEEGGGCRQAGSEFVHLGLAV